MSGVHVQGKVWAGGKNLGESSVNGQHLNDWLKGRVWMRGSEYSQRGEEVQNWALNLSFFVAGFHQSSQMLGVCPVLLQPQPRVFLPPTSSTCSPCRLWPLQMTFSPCPEWSGILKMKKENRKRAGDWGNHSTLQGKALIYPEEFWINYQL